MSEKAIPASSPLSIPKPSVTRKVTTKLQPSACLILKRYRASLKSIKPITATRMIAANTALGRWVNNGVKNSSVNKTSAAVKTDASGVRAPA